MVNSVVIVLGAASEKDASATPCMVRRTLSGCDYANQAEDAVLMLCGGQTSSYHFIKEADIMATVAVENGFPQARIVCEGQSRNTLENAIFAKRLIDENGWTDVSVVTDRFHLLRAKMVFKALGVKATFKAAHKEPKAGKSAVMSLFYEVVALLWYGVRILSGHHKQYRKVK